MATIEFAHPTRVSGRSGVWIELYLDERLREPDELELDVVGLRRKHVHAYWEGCAYVV